ncbi:GIY-YIG nuclease family protein [Chitinophaga caeni]|nr:GIY-YIG nuclease family protein [Chitinophaga caeni]
MNWYVHVIVSLQDGTFYKGITQDFHRRLEEYNSKQSTVFKSTVEIMLC